MKQVFFCPDVAASFQGASLRQWKGEKEGIFPSQGMAFFVSMQREGKQLTWRRKSAVLGGKKYVGNFTIYVKHVFCPCQIKGLFVFVKAASEELLAAEAVEQGQYQRYKLYVDTMNKKVDFPVSHNYHETILASRQIHRKMAASPLHWRSHQHTCPAVGQLWLKHKGATRSS